VVLVLRAAGRPLLRGHPHKTLFKLDTRPRERAARHRAALTEHRPRRRGSRSATPVMAGRSIPGRRAEDVGAELRYDLSSQACLGWEEDCDGAAGRSDHRGGGGDRPTGWCGDPPAAQDHWRVRALTRNPDGKKARALAQLGAEVVKADTSDPVSLERALDRVHGVFSVQNHHLSGFEGEVRQGKQVAEAAQRVGVAQVVYSGAGIGVGGTGVGSWETKVEVAWGPMRRPCGDGSAPTGQNLGLVPTCPDI
jgi:NmrA-like family